MRQLLENKLGRTDANSSLQQLILQSLPANVQIILVPANGSVELEQLVDMADKVMKVSTPMVLAVSYTYIIAAISDNSVVQQLREEISCLASLIDSLMTCSLRCDFSRHCRRTSPASPISSQGTGCWYNAKFGENAKNASNHVRRS